MRYNKSTMNNEQIFEYIKEYSKEPVGQVTFSIFLKSLIMDERLSHLHFCKLCIGANNKLFV